MRFFSNDARESAEDRNPDDRTPEQRAQDEQALNEQALDGPAGNDPDDRPGRVQSEPVAVPTQRAGSPWSDAPAEADADRRDDVTGFGAGRDDIDPPPFHDPGPQPTAFGASTVGGAVAASATANPLNDRRDETDRITAADSGVGDDASVAPGDGVVTSSTGTYAGGTVTAPDTVPATWTEKRDNDPDDIVDVPLDDQPAAVSARSGDPLVADQDRGHSTGPHADHDADRDANHDDAVTTFDADDTKSDEAKSGDTKNGDRKDEALKDEGTFDDPKAVDPATEQPLDSKVDTDDEPAVADTPVVAAVPVAAAPAAAASTALFDKDDASGFQERWRDVQLRFVDSPKDAAGDAAKLVEEAVEKLTAALRSQREGLHADTDDTEQLRVQLRGYRDMLNRIIGL